MKKAITFVVLLLIFSACAGFDKSPKISFLPGDIDKKCLKNRQALEKIDKLLREGVKNKAYPGFVFLGAKYGKVFYFESGGKLGRGSQSFNKKVSRDTVYDLASITKAVATTSAVMLLYDEGKLKLDDKISGVLPEFSQNGKRNITFRHLLTHSSGLPAWAPLYKKSAEKSVKSAEMVSKLMAMKLVYEPGRKSVYSCLGFIVLQKAVEMITGKPMDTFLQERVFGPLGMKNTKYFNIEHRTPNFEHRKKEEIIKSIAPTEFCMVRKKLLHGEVHDENAWLLGGVAGNAGLFSNAANLAVFAQMMLNKGIYEGKRIFKVETVEKFTAVQPINGENSSRALGWQKPSEGSSAGKFFSESSYGHTGFTGTALWIDPENQLFGIFLTNRVHPTRKNRKLYEFRSEVFNQLQLTVRPKIKVGAARIDHYLRKLQGKRIGLVVNQTAQVDGIHLIDIMLKNGVNVTTLFCPEHGIRGKALAGEKVDSSVDTKTGLPIVSLYGKSRKPSAQQLKDVDVMVFDIQDVGVRFYTYISTMHYVMEAAAENGKEVIILDRPNPNGDLVDGPIMEEKWRSFVGMHPIPVVHGLTVGELARMINGEGWLKNGAKVDKLTVVPMENYRHDLPYSLPVKPSPNLASDLSVRLYPSLGLFEATDISVGRGTKNPFEIIGYNDKRAGEFLEKVGPKGWPLANQDIYGESFSEIESFKVNSFDIAYFINWYQKLSKLGYKTDEIISRREWLAKLMGTDKFYQQVVEGVSEEKIRTMWQTGLVKYNKIRQKYLLYDDK